MAEERNRVAFLPVHRVAVSLTQTKKRERLSTLPLSCSGDNGDQVQTITPVALVQVLADCEWTADALQV